MSLLTIQIESFFIWQKEQENIIGRRRLLMDALLEKQLFKLIHTIMSETRKKHQSSTLRDINYWMDSYKLAEMDYYIDVFLQSKGSAKSLQEVVKALEQSCLGQLLRYYCAVSNTKQIIKISNFSFMEIVKKHIENSNESQEFVVEVYYQLLKLLEDKQPQDYYALKATLFESLNAFDTNELRTFFNVMTNYCNRKFKNGQEEFMQEKFEVYKKGIETKCWSAGVYFSEHQFIQIVKTALHLGELDWLDEFFQEHNSLLNPKVKEDIVHYYEALKAFELKKYDVAQSHLREISTNQDFAYYMESKVLLIKIYYDNNELTIDNADEHPINNERENIGKYVAPNTNKKMSETVRQQYSNFANFFKRILHRKKKLIDAYEKSPTQANLQALQNDLTQLKPLIERRWLEEKVKELMAALG